MAKDEKQNVKQEEAKAVDAAEKAAEKTDVKPAEMPAPPNVQTMSEQQKVLWQVAQTAPEPRRIESIRELAPEVKMAVPKSIKEGYPERSYRWADASKLRDECERNGGFWAPVTRSTHTKIPERYFDLATGLILYGGIDNGNALVYTYRSNTELKNKQIVQRYESKERAQLAALNAPLRDEHGQEIGQMYQTDRMSGGYSETELTNDKYDFGDPR